MSEGLPDRGCKIILDVVKTLLATSCEHGRGCSSLLIEGDRVDMLGFAVDAFDNCLSTLRVEQCAVVQYA